MIKNRQKIINNFHKKNFEIVRFYLLIELEKHPEDKELRFLSLLINLSKKNPDEAYSVFKMYETQADKDKFLDFTIFDKLNHEEYSLKGLDENSGIENGISFKDFMSIVGQNGDFKRAYDNVRFSTKLIISNIKDLKSFLKLLLMYKYQETLMSYTIKAYNDFPLDHEFSLLMVYCMFRKKKNENKN